MVASVDVVVHDDDDDDDGDGDGDGVDVDGVHHDEMPDEMPCVL